MTKNKKKSVLVVISYVLILLLLFSLIPNNHQVIAATSSSTTEQCQHSKVGNCGKWYSSFDEFITDYNAIRNKYTQQWYNDEITSEEYYAKCPCGYNPWKCLKTVGCNAWTGDYYYN